MINRPFFLLMASLFLVFQGQPAGKSCYAQQMTPKTDSPGPSGPKTLSRPQFVPLEEPVLAPFERFFRNDSTPTFAYTGELLAATTGRSVFVWDTVSGKLLGNLAGEDVNVQFLAFSQDNGRLFVLNRNGIAFHWDFRRNDPGRKIKLPAKAEDLIFANISSDGKTLAYAGLLTPLTIVNIETGKRVGTIDITADLLFSIRLSPNGKLILISYFLKDDLFLYSVPTMKLTEKFHFGGSERISFSPDSQFLAIGDAGGEPKPGFVWDIRKQATVHSFKEKEVNNIKFTPDGKKLFLWYQGGVRVLHMETGKTEIYKDCRLPFGQFSRNGESICTINDNDTITIWSVERKQEINRVKGKKSADSFQ